MSKSEKQWVSLCDDADIAEGGREVFEVGGRWIAVFRVSGRLYAIEDLCTHDGGILTEDEKGKPVPLQNDYEIACPRHGARFDIRTGKVLSAPALVDVPWFVVQVNAGKIEIAV